MSDLLSDGMRSLENPHFQKCSICGKITPIVISDKCFKCHDQEIREDERERVLGELIRELQPHYNFCQYKANADPDIYYSAREDIYRIVFERISELRKQGEPEENNGRIFKG
jgi:hypothetical protein